MDKNKCQSQEEGKASPPAPLQGERGGSKLKGCDSQDRGHTDKICEICEICGTKWRVSKKTRRTRMVRTGAIQTKSVKSVKSVGQNGQEKASPSAPLQGERGGSKLKGCDGQDRGIQTKSVKSVGQEWRESK